MVTETIELVLSPDSPSVTVAGLIVISSPSQYSDKDITVKINSTITEYENAPVNSSNMQIRQAMCTQDTSDAKTLKFDFAGDNVHEVITDGRKFSIKLLNIGKKQFEGQSFPVFEFFVEEL